MTPVSISSGDRGERKRLDDTPVGGLHGTGGRSESLRCVGSAHRPCSPIRINASGHISAATVCILPGLLFSGHHRKPVHADATTPWPPPLARDLVWGLSVRCSTGRGLGGGGGGIRYAQRHFAELRVLALLLLLLLLLLALRREGHQCPLSSPAASPSESPQNQCEEDTGQRAPAQGAQRPLWTGRGARAGADGKVPGLRRLQGAGTLSGATGGGAALHARDC